MEGIEELHKRGEGLLPPSLLLIIHILLYVCRAVPYKTFGDLYSKMLLIVNTGVGEDTEGPGFPIVFFRVEIQCSNENVVSFVCAWDRDIISVVAAEGGVGLKVVKGNWE